MLERHQPKQLYLVVQGDHYDKKERVCAVFLDRHEAKEFFLNLKGAFRIDCFKLVEDDESKNDSYSKFIESEDSSKYEYAGYYVPYRKVL